MAKSPPLEKEIDADDIEEKEIASAGVAEGGDVSGAESAPAQKSKKKLVIFGAIGLLLIIGAAVGVYYSGLLGGGEHEEAAEVGEDGKPLAKPVFFTMPDFLINLNTTGKQTSFLKATIVLELGNEADVKSIEANMPRLLDAYNTYMRELRSSDLVGSAGVQRLREELLLRANKTMAPVKINDVLFKEIIVQ
jgi:flagellar FliL protein